jgi:hypothetical protein
MMPDFISPWSDGNVRIPSPDGKYWAIVRDASELQMSGPMVGTLALSTGLIEDHCGVSIVWSDDSRFIAAPKLFPERPEFRVLIIRVADGIRKYAPGRMGPLTLSAFRDQRLTIIRNGSVSEIDLSFVRW